MAFIDLPEDIMLCILCSLDARSLIRLRLTCRAFSTLSRMRIVWATAFHTQNDGYPGPPYLLERPLKSYSASEVEEIVVHQTRLDASGGDALKSPVKVKHLPSDFSGKVFLLEGGRWCIRVPLDRSDEVWYYDLNAEVITERVLIQLDGERSGRWMTRLMWSIDGDSERFSFFLTITLGQSYYGRYSGIPQELAFWKVDLADDGNGLDARLSHAFEVVDGGNSEAANSFLGETYLRYRRDLQSFEVFDWPRCSSNIHHKTFVVPNNPTDPGCVLLARLLSPTRFLVLLDRAGGQMEMYAINAATPTTPNQEDDGVARSYPIWRYQCQPNHQPNHSPYVYATSPIQRFHRLPSPKVPFFTWFGNTVYICNFTSAGTVDATIHSAPAPAPDLLRRNAGLGWRRGMVGEFSGSRAVLITVDVDGRGRDSVLADEGGQLWTLRELKAAVPDDLPLKTWIFDGQSGRLLVGPFVMYF